MTNFQKYSSACVAGMGNQYIFNPVSSTDSIKYRSYYKITVSDDEFALLYSNTLDSTMNNNNYAKKNYVISDWTIDSLRVGIVKNFETNKCGEAESWTNVTFDGKNSIIVKAGEFLWTDTIHMHIDKEDYICVEISCHGNEIPCQPERTFTTFVYLENEWKLTNLAPAVSMIGCTKKFKKKICFFGDSITQGIGTGIDTYEHYAAVIAKELGDDYAYWDIGLGCGRADDAASDGAWMTKALQSDIVFLCYGINDIFNEFTVEETKNNLTHIVQKLKSAGIKVFIQVCPPFSMTDHWGKMWWEVNEFIESQLSKECDAYFDNRPLLGNPEDLSIAMYGNHPDSYGHKIWGEALVPVLKQIL